MKVIKEMIKECKQKCAQNESYYFVILFICLYAKGNIFGTHRGHLLIDDALKQTLLNDYLPSYVEINEFKISFLLFESCQCFNDLYRKYTEQILINKCKNFMITSNKMENKLPFHMDDNFSFSEWNIGLDLKGKKLTNAIEKLFYQLSKNEITEWNVTLLDGLVFESKMSTYNQYFRHSAAFREFETHSFTLANATTVNIDELIPDFEQNKGLQIHEVIISEVLENKHENDEDKEEEKEENANESHTISEINFDIGDDKYSIWNQKDYEMISKKLVINAQNIGLSVYNYHLLHSEATFPPIRIVSNNDSKLYVSVKYTQLHIESLPLSLPDEYYDDSNEITYSDEYSNITDVI